MGRRRLPSLVDHLRYAPIVLVSNGFGRSDRFCLWAPCCDNIPHSLQSTSVGLVVVSCELEL